jgi:hypothetical protein
MACAQHPGSRGARRVGRALRTIVVSALLFSGGCTSSWNDIVWGPSTVVRERSPSPAPSPSAPSPAPTPTAPPSSPNAPPEPNRAPVARVGARVYFVECQGQIVSGWDSTSAPVGCRVHMDCTPRDAADLPTEPRSLPLWHLSDMTLVSGGSRTSYTPAFTVVQPGSLVLQVEVDGIRSNSVLISLF